MDGREAAIRVERRKIYLAETRMVLKSHHDPAWKFSDEELVDHLIAKTYQRENEGPEEARIARRIRELLLLPGVVIRDGNGQGPDGEPGSKADAIVLDQPDETDR